MYLSYSGWKKYKSCPRAYWHGYVDKTVTPEPDNKINSLYGSVVGGLFEIFYKDKVWRQPDPEAYLLEHVDSTLDAVIAKEVESNGPACIRWNEEKSNYKDPETLLSDVRSAIPRGLETIRFHMLIGPKAGAEIKLDTPFGAKGEHTLGGRADFIVRQARTNQLLLTDGKGSKYREQYVDPDQLRWYAGLWAARTGSLPDRLGFIYWRFERAVDWIRVSKTEVDAVLEEGLAAVSAIEGSRLRLALVQEKEPDRARKTLQEEFPPHPGDQCRLCAYKTVCDAGKSILEPRPVSSKASSGVDSREQVLSLEDVDL